MDLGGYTPLMTAVAYGSTRIAKALLKRKANINIHDTDEKSLIFIAVENERVDVLEVMSNLIIFLVLIDIYTNKYSEHSIGSVK